MQAQQLFDWPEELPFGEYFDPAMKPWQWVPQIAKALADFPFHEQCTAPQDGSVFIGSNVYMHPTVKLPNFCHIQGPAWIGAGVEIRPGAYVRGNVIVGAGSVLGNSCEYKNCLLLEKVETPHYNYVGDSILGNRAHLGAGVICANLRLARDVVVIRLEDGTHPTGLRKLGALVGDGAEVSCNSVLQPGTILGKAAVVINTAFGGFLPEGKMAVGSSRPRILARPGNAGA